MDVSKSDIIDRLTVGEVPSEPIPDDVWEWFIGHCAECGKLPCQCKPVEPTGPKCRNCGWIEADFHCPDCGACYYEDGDCSNPACDGPEE